MTGLGPFANPFDERGRAARPAHEMPGIQAIYRRTFVLSAVVIAVLCIGSAAFVLAVNSSAGTLRLTVIGVSCGVALVLGTALIGARAVTRQVADQIRTARLLAQRGQAELGQLTDKILRGEAPAPLTPVPPRAAGHDNLQQLSHDLEETRYAAGQAILQIAGTAPGGRPNQPVEIFVNLARRMQSLVHREIELLDDLEAKVEDPDLLKGLFTIDHLATRMRRQSESLSVLGGSPSRRQWTRQVTMHEVLRAAVAEVEQYSRVKVVPPVEGVLRGAAVSDVIHLIAELVENATKFSAPRTQALIRAQKVAAGVAIEIEDRGLGILPADMQRLNALLFEPSRFDVGELLRDGRIGLYVVSTLARRHDIRVQLQANIYGAISAIVVLPAALLDDGDDNERQLPRSVHVSDRELVTVASVPPPAPVPPAPAPPAPAPPAPVQTVRPASATPPPAQPADRPPADRPSLPRREPQVSLPPHLRAGRGSAGPAASADAQDEPPADQMPGLMADFLKGVGRSAEAEAPAGTDDTQP